MKRMKELWMLLILTFIGIIIASCSSDDSSDDGGSDTGSTDIIAPVATDATNVSTNGFTANWNSVFGAASYQLDVSSKEDFSTLLEGYDGRSVTAFTIDIEGLDDNVQYYYKVRAIRGDDTSMDSNIISVKTDLEVSEEISLKTEANFLVGVAVSENRVGNTLYDEVYTKEFNSLTAENDMKMRSIFKNLDASNNIVYDWTAADGIVNYADANDMNVHGHTLIWHRSIPDALQNFAGSNEEFENIIEQYIKAVLTRYKGKIDSWDVVNEAIDDDENIQWRNTLFFEKMGPNYVEKCFAFARAADPDVKLFYNDYNMTFDDVKRGKVLALVDDLKVENLIDGVGYQMHIDHNFPPKGDIQKATDQLLAKDLLIHFAELDVKLNAAGDLTELTPQRAEDQKQKVKEVVEIFNALPAKNQYALTLWGLKDNDSWIPGEYGRPDWPLLFDRNFERKPAYDGFIEGLQ